MQKNKNKTSGRSVVSEVRNSNWDAFNVSSILNLLTIACSFSELQTL